MPQNRHARFLLTLFYAALGAAALVVCLPPLAPFLVAALVAALLERPVAALATLFGNRRWPAALTCTLLSAAALIGGLFLLLRRGSYEIGILIERFPLMLARLPSFRQATQAHVYRFLVALPVEMQDYLRTAISDLLAKGITVPASLYEWLMDGVARVATAVPTVMLFSFTTLLAVYFISSRRPALVTAAQNLVPKKHRALVETARARLAQAVGGWLRVQGILLLVCFFLLTAGLLLLGVDLAFLIAAGTALLDALPVFGVGAVLIPWAISCFFAGDYLLGLGLTGLYAVVWLARSVLEPKLMGDKAGLPPLAALVAMCAGFHFFGVGGMILAPLAAAAVRHMLAGVTLPWQSQQTSQAGAKPPPHD